MGALDAGVVDRCLFFYAPIIIGAQTLLRALEALGSAAGRGPRLVTVKAFRVGSDILLDGRVIYAGSKDC